MDIKEVGTLANASENSLEAIYEICLLIAGASGNISQPRVDGLRDVFDSIRTGMHHVENWEVPADQQEPFVLIIAGEDIGPGHHERLLYEFGDSLAGMDSDEFEDYLLRCASLITGKLYRLLTLKMALLACEPEGAENPELHRISKFLNWWGFEDETSKQEVLKDLADFSEELQLRFQQ